MKIKKIVISLFILLISISYYVYADTEFDNTLKSYLVTKGISEDNINKIMKYSDSINNFCTEMNNSSADFESSLMEKSRTDKDLGSALFALNASSSGTGTTGQGLMKDFYTSYNTKGSTKIQEEVKGTVTYQDNPSVYTGSSTTSKSSSSQSSSTRNSSNTTSTGSDTGFSLDAILGQAQEFSDSIKKGASGDDGGFLSLGGIFDGIIDMIFTIGNLIILVAIVFMGLRYVWSGAQGKSDIKESMINMSAGVIFFYLAQGIYDFLAGIFVGYATASSFDQFGKDVWSTVALIAQYGSLIGLIAVGLRYMLNNADTKADIKKQLFPVILGLVLIFCVTNVATFIINVGQEALGQNGEKVDTSITSGGDVVDGVEDTLGRVYGSLALIFQMLAVGAMIFTGIRFMFASADTRADIKGQTIILLLGAVIVFGAVEIIKSVAKIGNEALTKSSIETNIVIARSIDE